MSKTNYYFFSFIFLLILLLSCEIIYLFMNKSYSTQDIAQKSELLRVAKFSNLNSAIRDNTIELHR